MKDQNMIWTAWAKFSFRHWWKKEKVSEDWSQPGFVNIKSKDPKIQNFIKKISIILEDPVQQGNR
jgi:hypothetical protein